MDENEFIYSARRSREEAVRAIGAGSPAAAQSHWLLSALHARRAARAMASADD